VLGNVQTKTVSPQGFTQSGARRPLSGRGESVTTDLKDRRIRSNVVSPGPINTLLTKRRFSHVIARIVSTVPMGRMGEPDEVAKAALFLASDDSSFVTGIELFVDGGRAQVLLIGGHNDFKA
jgi:NAD(P)-dependent dehydrogenase (short-subunit alcohol dehydrogenase family)